MASETLQDRICEILTRYRVQKHHQASRDSRGVRYAVFSGAPIYGTLQQHGEPMPHIEAEEYRRRLTAMDIEALVRDPATVLELMARNDA